MIVIYMHLWKFISLLGLALHKKSQVGNILWEHLAIAAISKVKNSFLSCTNVSHILQPGFLFSFFKKCQSGDIKCYSGAPNFNILPNIG